MFFILSVKSLLSFDVLLRSPTSFIFKILRSLCELTLNRVYYLEISNKCPLAFTLI